MLQDLLKELNGLDEHPTLEAKSCATGALGDSFFETVCAFCNEPDMGGGTYYLPGQGFPVSAPSPEHTTLASRHTTLAREHTTLAFKHTTLAADSGSAGSSLADLYDEIPMEIRTEIKALGARPGNKIREVILRLCAWRDLSATQLTRIFGRRDAESLRRDHLAPMVADGSLVYLYPEMERHPQQAYKTRERPLVPESADLTQNPGS